MTFKRKVFISIVNSLQFLFQRKKLQKSLYFNCAIDMPLPENHIDIISIAFNNTQVIEHQIRLIKKNIIDDNYSHIIVDNSPDRVKREIIKSLCEKEGVGYISLPKHYFNFILRMPSYSHGAAMNWIYNNFVKLRQPAFFGFIDHDIFPIKPYSVLEKIKNQLFYGRYVNRGKGWYLWAGFCFFEYDKVKNLKLNFFPSKVEDVYLDTGGANHVVLYSKYEEREIKFTAPDFWKPIREGDCYHSDYVQYIDNDWLHAINGSYWKEVESKENILNDILSCY